jgi:hypothetical protein
MWTFHIATLGFAFLVLRVASNQPTSNQAVRLVDCLCQQSSDWSIDWWYWSLGIEKCVFLWPVSEVFAPNRSSNLF